MSRDTTTRYKFAPLENGAFFFPSDDGSYYTVAIEEAGFKFWNSEKLSSDDKIFEMSYNRKCDDIADPDDAACNTIKHIFSTNILSRGDLYVYYHIWEQGDIDTQLYEHWYVDMEEALSDYEAFDFQAYEAGKEEAYITSVFIHKNHPDKESLVEEFEKEIKAEEHN